MSFIIINDNDFLGISKINGQEYLVILEDDNKPQIWSKDENGIIKTSDRNFYIDVQDDGIFVRPLNKEKLTQLWYYDRGCICNRSKPDWVLGCENAKIIAGPFASTPRASLWKFIPLDIDSDKDIKSEYEDVEEDDFVIVPIPDCFDQNLPPRKEASTVVVVRSKSQSDSNKKHNKIDTDSSSNNTNSCTNILSKSEFVNDLSSNENNVVNISNLVNDVRSSNLTEIENDKNDIDNHLDPFEDASDNLEASTLKVLTSAFSMANNFLGKTVSVAKDVFYTLQAKDYNELDNEKKNEAWCPPQDKWIPKTNTWEPKKNLWMPQEQCWMPEEGPWSPVTTPWMPKEELWMPKTDLWMPKEGHMEKLFEMGFTDRRKNLEVLDKYNNFDEVVDKLSEIKHL